MRKALAAILGVSTIATPLTSEALAAARGTTTKAKTTTRKLNGSPAYARDWGTVHIVVTAKITGTGKSRKVRYSDLGGSYSYHTSRSQYIMSTALPMLRQEFLQAQSANIQLISGATDTSMAFEQSLQSALLKLSK